MKTFYDYKLCVGIFNVIGWFYDKVFCYETSKSTYSNQIVSQGMHSLRFLSLTGPCKGSLLLTHVTFYLYFYIASQCENQILADDQNAPLKVFHSVNF